MKKKFVVLAVVATIVSFQSCKKEPPPQPPLVTVINKTLAINEKFTFTLPATDTKEGYQLRLDASHFSISDISKDAAGNEVYEYTPALNYVGTDNATVSDAKDDGEHHPPHAGPKLGPAFGGHHHCDKDDAQRNTVEFNFTIVASSATKSNVR